MVAFCKQVPFSYQLTVRLTYTADSSLASSVGSHTQPESMSTRPIKLFMVNFFTDDGKPQNISREKYPLYNILHTVMFFINHEMCVSFWCIFTPVTHTCMSLITWFSPCTQVLQTDEVCTCVCLTLASIVYKQLEIHFCLCFAIKLEIMSSFGTSKSKHSARPPET